MWNFPVRNVRSIVPQKYLYLAKKHPPSPQRVADSNRFAIHCFVSGWYWIDPNLGMPYDAVYVYCNMSSGGETCVFPDIHSSQMPNIPWRKEADKTDWYSNLRGGFKVRTRHYYSFRGVLQVRRWSGPNRPPLRTPKGPALRFQKELYVVCIKYFKLPELYESIVLIGVC